jgi:glutathione peroxidase
MDSPFYSFTARTIRGEDFSLESCRGKVVLIVNVASACGFTPQYAGLEALYRRHAGRGLLVLGFPCDQFGHQEPGDEAAIESFCSVNYGVTFPLFAKVEVNGPGAHPLFAYLKSAQPGFLGTRAIKWNFTKFLVDRAGEVVVRFGSRDTPESIEAAILPLLDAAAPPAPGKSPA